MGSQHCSPYSQQVGVSLFWSCAGAHASFYLRLPTPRAPLCSKKHCSCIPGSNLIQLQDPLRCTLLLLHARPQQHGFHPMRGHLGTSAPRSAGRDAESCARYHVVMMCLQPARWRGRYGISIRAAWCTVRGCNSVLRHLIEEDIGCALLT